MTRIVHLSDLHFGAHDPALMAPLRTAVEAQRADLVVISGDLTQRGTRGQYRLARAYLASLPRPMLCVPGNHDLPHYNPLLRVFDPYGRFRRASRGPEEPVWRQGDAVVAGINTANRWRWMRGKVTPPHVAGLRARLALGEAAVRVAVMHHPLEHAALNVDRLMQGARGLLNDLPGMGAQIALSGHIHVSYVAPFRDRPEVLFVQCGTSLSTRRRGEENCFQTLDLAPGRARIATHYAGRDGFVGGPVQEWRQVAGCWAQPEAKRAQA